VLALLKLHWISMGEEKKKKKKTTELKFLFYIKVFLPWVFTV